MLPIKVRIPSDAALLNSSLRKEKLDAFGSGFIPVDVSAICLPTVISEQTFSNLSGGTLLTRY